MSFEEIAPSEANHRTAVELLRAACHTYLAGCEKMRDDVRKSLDDALSTQQGSISVNVTILPNPFIEVLYEPLTGDTRMLFSLTLAVDSPAAAN